MKVDLNEEHKIVTIVHKNLRDKKGDTKIQKDMKEFSRKKKKNYLQKDLWNEDLFIDEYA